MTSRVPGVGRGVPGVGAGWVPGGVLYRVLPRHHPGPIFSHILSLRPYPRPYEGKSEVNDEVSQIGSRIGSRIDLRLTSRSTLQTHPQTGPEMPPQTLISRPQGTNGPE